MNWYLDIEGEVLLPATLQGFCVMLCVFIHVFVQGFWRCLFFWKFVAAAAVAAAAAAAAAAFASAPRIDCCCCCSCWIWGSVPQFGLLPQQRASSGADGRAQAESAAGCDRLSVSSTDEKEENNGSFW